MLQENLLYGAGFIVGVGGTLVGLAIGLGLIDNPFPDNGFFVCFFCIFFFAKCSLFLFPLLAYALFFCFHFLLFGGGGHELTLYKIRLT